MIEFVKRKIKTLTLGEKLKKIREEAGVSLSEIAINTKIKREYLEKIEEGKYNELPFDVYVKGFLRSYAKYLGLDAEKVVGQFNKEIGVRENVKKYQNKSKEINKFKIPSLIITPKMTSIFLSVLIFLVGFAYFYLEVDSFSREPNLNLEKSSFNSIVKDSSVEIKGKTDFENKITINNQPVYVDNEGNFREKVGLQNGLNEIKVEAFNKFENKTEKIINVIAEYEAEIKTEVAGEKAEENKEFEVEIESREEEVEILIKKDDQEEFKESVLYPEMSLKFKVLEKIEINSGNPQDTYVKINGEEFFVLSEEAQNQNSFIINKKGVVSEEEGNSETGKN
jgi:cytoskeletal protein RodZ